MTRVFRFVDRPVRLGIRLALLGASLTLPTTALAQRDYEIDRLIFRDNFDGDLREWMIEKRPQTQVQRVCLQIVGWWSTEYPVESQGFWSFLQEERPWTTTSS